MKLLIMGQENVGKTSLVKDFAKHWPSKENIFDISDKNISTDGVDIDTFYFDYEVILFLSFFGSFSIYNLLL